MTAGSLDRNEANEHEANSRPLKPPTKRLLFDVLKYFGMSDLRLRIELNKGGIGISFHKLAEISVEAEKFLRMIISDVDKRITGTWIAKDFDNNSVDFTAEFSGNITQEQAVLCSNALDATMKEDFDFAVLEQHRVRRATLLQYTKIAKPIAPDEAIHFAILNGNKPSRKGTEKTEGEKRHVLTKDHSITLAQKIKLTDTVSFQGSIQGVITALFKDQAIYSKPHFRLRELYSEALISCYYTPDLYEKIIYGLHNKDSVVHVAGLILASRTERKPLSIEVKKIVVAEPYQEGDLGKFIGCAPEATGEFTTEQFIEHVRDRQADSVIQNEEIT